MIKFNCFIRLKSMRTTYYILYFSWNTYFGKKTLKSIIFLNIFKNIWDGYSIEYNFTENVNFESFSFSLVFWVNKENSTCLPVCDKYFKISIINLNQNFKIQNYNFTFFCQHIKFNSNVIYLLAPVNLIQKQNVIIFIISNDIVMAIYSLGTLRKCVTVYILLIHKLDTNTHIHTRTNIEWAYK